jgi:hypothetical protein
MSKVVTVLVNVACLISCQWFMKNTSVLTLKQLATCSDPSVIGCKTEFVVK